MSEMTDIRPPKTALAGTKMFRRNDVFGALAKLVAFAWDNYNLAVAEGRWDDADVQKVRLRTLNTARDAILDNSPIFINADTVEASPPPSSMSVAPENGEK